MIVKGWLSKQSAETLLLVFALLISLLHGVLRAAIVPAWGNPEEPYHFVRARALAYPEVPPQQIVQEVVDSIVWIDTRAGVGGVMHNARLQHELELSDAEAWDQLRQEMASQPAHIAATDFSIGSSQSGEAPGYYWYQALFQWIAVQLRLPLESALLLSRLSTVALGVLTVWLSYLIARHIFQNVPLMRAAVPLILAVHPNFMNEMASVNNTAGAVMAITLLIYASLRWVNLAPGSNGLRYLIHLVGILIGAAACLLTKTTAWVGLLLVVLPFVLAYRQLRNRSILIAAALASIVMLLLLFRWEGRSYWYPWQLTTLPSEDAPTGQTILFADRLIFQPLTGTTANEVRGQTVTLGAWVRSDAGITSAPLPEIWSGSIMQPLIPLPESSVIVPVTAEWEFHSAVITLPPETQCVEVRILPAWIHYDGIVLAEGELTSEQLIEHNLLLNGSFEQQHLLLNPEIEKLFPANIADTGLVVNARLAALQDWQTSLPLMWISMRWLFSSFWSRFLWTVPGLPAPAIWGLGALTGISAIGLVFHLIRSIRTREDQRGILLCIAYAAAGVALALLRIDPPNGFCTSFQGRYIGAGYYIAPFSVPLLILWITGLTHWVPKQQLRWIIAGTVLLLSVLTVGSIINGQIPFALSLYGLDVPASWWSLPTR